MLRRRNVCGKRVKEERMKCDLELVLTHDGRNWRGHVEELDIHVKGESLGALDAALMSRLAALPRFAGRRVCVAMRFDNTTIPTWIRQYASHYFNRLVELDLSGMEAVET